MKDILRLVDSDMNKFEFQPSNVESIEWIQSHIKTESQIYYYCDVVGIKPNSNWIQVLVKNNGLLNPILELIKRGANIDTDCIVCALRSSRFELASDLIDICMSSPLTDQNHQVLNIVVMRTAAGMGSETMVRKLLNLSCPFDTYCTSMAAGSGNIKVFDLLIQNDCSFNETSLTVAILMGKWEMYDHLITKFTFLSGIVVSTLSRMGRLDLIKKLLFNPSINVEIDETLIISAIMRKRFEIVKWARDELIPIAPWNATCSKLVIQTNNQEMIDWMIIERNSPLDVTCLISSLNLKNAKVTKFIVNKHPQFRDQLNQHYRDMLHEIVSFS